MFSQCFSLDGEKIDFCGRIFTNGFSIGTHGLMASHTECNDFIFLNFNDRMVKEIKSSGVFGGQAKTPTVIPPSRYKGRFEEAMNRYFSVVQ